MSCPKISSIADLKKAHADAQKLLKLRCVCDNEAEYAEKRDSFKKGEYDISLCLGTSCLSSGAAEVKTEMLTQLEERGLDKKVHLIQSGCNGFCAAGPILAVYPGGYLYLRITAEDVSEIIESHFINDKPVERLMYKDKEARSIPSTASFRFLPIRNCVFCTTKD